MTMHWYDWAGLGGVALILLAYFLLQAGRVRGDALGYQLMNAAGALAVLISLLFAFNLCAFVMEAAWLAVSIYGIARGRKARRKS
jgi:paired small multidrug resistance pump